MAGGECVLVIKAWVDGLVVSHVVIFYLIHVLVDIQQP